MYFQSDSNANYTAFIYNISNKLFYNKYLTQNRFILINKIFLFKYQFGTIIYNIYIYIYKSRYGLLATDSINSEALFIKRSFLMDISLKSFTVLNTSSFQHIIIQNIFNNIFYLLHFCAYKGYYRDM